ncbi:MAG: vWA domain-containing protein [Bacteroidota bacterium]|nr:vWA domain-containing protein [Bacteroidota bacterium]
MDASNLIVQAEPWQWLALTGMVLGLTGLLYGWGAQRPTPTWLLALLRLGVLSILGFLLLNPMLRSTTETREAPVLPVLVDATSSQWIGRDSILRRAALSDMVADLNTWGSDAEWNVELFGFDRDVQPLSRETWTPDGKRTDLGSAFETLRDRFVHRNVPAVLVVTDGRANRGPNPEFTAERLDVPHVFVGTGDTSMVADLELSKLRTNDVAYLGNAFPVEVTAQARGAQGIPMSLKLTSGSTTHATTTWMPQNELSSTQWTVQLDADKAGPMPLTASIAPLERWDQSEVTLRNNANRATVEVLESRRQILILAQTPHPDVAALRQAMETNAHQETVVIWADELVNGFELPEHDVLVMHHIDPKTVPQDVLETSASDRALWIFGGVSTSWNAWPVNVVGFQHDPEPLVTEAQGLGVDAFEPFPLPTDLERMTSLWPPLACPTGDYQSTPSLVPALVQRVGPVSTDWPLWAVREGSQQRVAVTLGEGLWRWRMQDLLRHDGQSLVFDDLVNRTVQYLSSRDDIQRLRIDIPERLDEDMRCEVVAEVYDASLSPTLEADVTLELKPLNSPGTRHRFVERTQGLRFELDLGTLLPGIYNWVASCTQSGESLSQRGTLIVNAIQAEASLVPANHGLLRRLADMTEGTFLGTLNTPNDLNGLKEAWLTFRKSVNTRDVIHTSTERLPLHAQIWLLVVLLGMLSAEWSIRRLGGGR